MTAWLVTPVFLASLVEAVEAATIILAVGIVRGWRAALLGASLGLFVLAIVVVVLGSTLESVPVSFLQIAIGLLLLSLGLSWLRKSVLRYAGRLPLHDESAAFATETTSLGSIPLSMAGMDWAAILISFKAVLLEGLEVVLIVIAVGLGGGRLQSASLSALAACLLVAITGFALRRPLTRVPENALKFAVASMLCAFGIFWLGEGLGYRWPGGDLVIFALIALFAGTGGAAAKLIQS
jgi:uncharacterized membrane protein